MRTDEHRMALVTSGTKLISFNMLTQADMDALQNSDYSKECDILKVMEALTKI